MALDATVVEAVTNANFKAVAEQVAFFTNQGMADALQDQRDSRLITKSIVGSLCKRIVESDVQEAVALAKNATADLPNRQVELGSASAQAQQMQVALAAIAQILTKIAQTTSPETGK
jgi:signal-transduction protein with cAMP-binding, CBS, and nucleotidyltransferase domain